MSKHIKKQVIATGAVAGLGALVGTASADTIVYANGDQGAENHNLQAAISGNKNQAVNAEYDNNNTQSNAGIPAFFVSSFVVNWLLL